ncbi:unnamed protein product [Didymodactylos carnosus]|uniref:Uncharacterized protein n=1 Tax=Didymodactylos carnosus TaxID=1234261 RepID=A0A8S2J7R9_9BILA|nr:unnamed protein product [Didymodactylos carnosus]CAF3796999.1 unnamed protein product [Didymodactylos carnosus]
MFNLSSDTIIDKSENDDRSEIRKKPTVTSLSPVRKVEITKRCLHETSFVDSMNSINKYYKMSRTLEKKNFSKKNNYFKMNMNNVSVPNRVGSLQSLKYDIMNDQLSIKNNDYETDELDFDKHTSSSKQNETLHKVIISISSLPQHYCIKTLMKISDDQINKICE